MINEFLFICVFSFFISEKQIQILFQEPCAYIAIIWFVKALIYWLSCIPFSFLFLFFNNLFFYVPMHSMCPTWGWWHYNQLPVCLMCPKGQCWSQVMTDNLQYEVDSEGRQSVVHLMRLLLCFLCCFFDSGQMYFFLRTLGITGYMHLLSFWNAWIYWFWVAFHGVLVTTLYISKHSKSSSWTCSWNSPFWLKVSDSVSLCVCAHACVCVCVCVCARACVWVCTCLCVCKLW